jgi:hypothetical protein
MEFQSQDENGDPAWYKLIKDDPTPVKVLTQAFGRVCYRTLTLV